MAADHEITIGKEGTLGGMRNHLQFDHEMLQVWAGKAEGDVDFIIFVSENVQEFVILTSQPNSAVYTITDYGQIMFMHSKNLRMLAKINDK